MANEDAKKGKVVGKPVEEPTAADVPTTAS